MISKKLKKSVNSVDSNGHEYEQEHTEEIIIDSFKCVDPVIGKLYNNIEMYNESDEGQPANMEEQHIETDEGVETFTERITYNIETNESVKHFEEEEGVEELMDEEHLYSDSGGKEESYDYHNLTEEAEECEEEEVEEEDEEEEEEEEIETISPDNVKDISNCSNNNIHIWNYESNAKDSSGDLSDSSEDHIIPETRNRLRTRHEDEEVEEEQCRVCTDKEDLVSLFTIVNEYTVADMLMTICPNVSIATKDFLPQYICNKCLNNVIIAVQLKNQCEGTERELRKKLSRHKNKIRRPKGYVVIDAPLDSDPATEEELNNDEEFKVSDEASTTPDDDSDDSDFSDSIKKRTRRTGGRRGRPKRGGTLSHYNQKSSQLSQRSRVPVKRSNRYESSGEEELWQAHKKVKQKRVSASDVAAPMDFPCNECGQVFSRKLSLILHQKTHTMARTPIKCEVCGKLFKMRGAYRTHLDRHRDDSFGFKCEICHCILPTNADLKRHINDQHDDNSVLQCKRCKRIFVSSERLQRHKDRPCPGPEKTKRPDPEALKIGNDLFKSVAPITTTYWSDTFSD